MAKSARRRFAAWELAVVLSVGVGGLAGIAFTVNAGGSHFASPDSSTHCAGSARCYVDRSTDCENSTLCNSRCEAPGSCAPRQPPANGTFTMRVYDENGRPVPGPGTCLALPDDADGQMTVPSANIQDGVCTGAAPGRLTHLQSYVWNEATRQMELWGKNDYSIPPGGSVDFPPMFRQNARFTGPATGATAGDGLVLDVGVVVPGPSPDLRVECNATRPDGSLSLTSSDTIPGENGTYAARCAEVPPDATRVVLDLKERFEPHPEVVASQLYVPT
ncbi:MAG: hypothetical protein QOE90_1249 [Thermoplasmata archaeon]|jgi:hypothetical protein|nr:hypothetical protein [Thermoplasmata archaeon]